jgi:hypothetical protein
MKQELSGFALNFAMKLFRAWVGSGMFDRLAALVITLIYEDIPGSDKKNRVLEFLESEYGRVWGVATDVVIDILIGFARAKAYQTVGKL